MLRSMYRRLTTMLIHRRKHHDRIKTSNHLHHRHRPRVSGGDLSGAECVGGDMYVYIRSEQSVWTVGFYKPDGEWVPERDYSDKEDAAERVNYLNGGEGVRPLT